MSLYPSLEDMQVSHMVVAQTFSSQHAASSPASNACGSSVSYPCLSPPPPYGDVTVPSMMHRTLSDQNIYPSLDDYMGMNMHTQEASRTAQALYPVPPAQMRQVALNGMSAPLTAYNGGLAGLCRGQVSHGIRQIVLCKGGDGKIGMKVRAASKGVFVSLVVTGSPAALAGLRFGDQLLQIDGENVAGWSDDKSMKKLRQANAQRVEVIVRDRPYERNITMHRGTTRQTLGFSMRNGGEIFQIVKDSSAARNGVLIDHQLLEINGQNVIGLDQKKINEIIDNAGASVTITIMPTFIFRHMMKNIAGDLVKARMNHSVPDA